MTAEAGRATVREEGEPSAGDLDDVVQVLRQTRWAAAVADGADRLRWVSEEFKYFLRESDAAKIGIGQHVLASLVSDTMRATITQESQAWIFQEVLPFLVQSFRDDPDQPRLPEPFAELVAALPARPRPEAWTGAFGYTRPDLPPYDVRFLMLRMRHPDGRPRCTVLLTFMDQPAPLVALLTGGDFAAHARLAQLAEPARHGTAVLFVDLQGSTALSRRLATAEYFDVIRRVTSTFDALTCQGGGVVGKHVGDGMTAFFLAEQTGGPASAAAAALRTVRGLQAAVSDLAAELDLGEMRINAGLHWGSGLYLGQLVPGGRLEITAIGDEVNEAARLQEAARDGTVLASKSFVELLDPADLAELRVPSHPRYRPLQELPTVTAKGVADAGQVSVTALDLPSTDARVQER
jgi:class 3 adenylate cyclase